MKKLTTIAAGCGILATLALVGCGPASETEPTETAMSDTSQPSTATPTPTSLAGQPYVTDPPASAAEAIGFASGAASAYDKLAYELHANPTLPADLEALGFGTQLETTRSNAAKLAEAGVHLQGSPSFEVDEGSSFAQDATNAGTGEPVPFGIVTLKGCTDYSAVSSVRADGVVTPWQGPERARTTISVVYSPEDGRWLVGGSDVDQPVTTC